MNILWGLGGIIVILGIAYAFSINRRAINPRTILIALVLQITFAFIVLKWETGNQVLQWFTNIVGSVIETSAEGIQFVFGGVLQGDGIGFEIGRAHV